MKTKKCKQIRAEKALRKMAALFDERGKVWVARSMRTAPEVDGIVEVTTRRPRRRGEFVQATYTEQAGYDMVAAE